jgi:predicted nucleotidyltransferase
MAKEMQAYFLERVRAMQTRAEEVPQELQELNARIERLRDRLRRGDPDMTADEVQAAIDRAETKRGELEALHPERKQCAKVFGSVVRGRDTESSALDILVDPLPGATLFDLGGLQIALQELLGVPVDFLTPGDLPHRARERVLREAVPV